MKLEGTIAMALTIASLLATGCRRYQSYTDTIEVNGTPIFYAAEGKGKPVVLLHGNGGSHSALETTQRQLAQAGYMVYALDSRGQGANPRVEEYHYKDMAEDTYAFIQAKKLHRPAVYGWSDGGIIALELESMHPGTCSLLAVSGANITVEGAFAPGEEIVSDDASLDAMDPLVRMMFLEPDMSDEDMARIKCPVLVLAGENDAIAREHTELIARSLPDSELKILPGENHGSYIWHNPLLGNILIEYFSRKGF